MDKSLYFDRAGEPITMLEWSAMYKDDAIKRVASDHIDVDGVDVWVSTVWLGLNHSLTGGVLIFETMIFDGTDDHFQQRYETEEQALTGHATIVDMLKVGGRL